MRRDPDGNGLLCFVTTVVYGRLPIFTSAAFVIPLFDSLGYYCARYGVIVIGFVIMPDHMHLLLLPTARADLSGFLRDFKEFTAKRIVRQAEAEGRDEWLAAFRQAGEATGRAIHKVWQDDNWETVVFSDRVVRSKLAYIHNNPVRAGLVLDPRLYPYSSCRNYGLGIIRCWLWT